MVAMGVSPTSGKNYNKFDHITMAQMAEQRLNNLLKLLIIIKVIWKRNKSSYILCFD